MPSTSGIVGGESETPRQPLLQPIIDGLPAAALVFDGGGTVRAINSPAEQLLGVTRDFIIGKGVELTNSLYVTREVRDLRNRTIFDHELPWGGDWAKVHASGAELPAKVQIIPIASTRCYLEVLEPSDEATAIGDLERQIMSSLLEVAPLALLVADSRDQIAYANPAFVSRFHRGKPLDNAAPLSRFFETSDYLRLFGKGRRTLPGASREPATLLTADGQRVSVRVTLRHLSDESGKYGFSLVGLEDASELEGALEDAGLLLEATRHISEAIVFADLRGQLFFANEAATRLFGKSEDELTGVNVDELLGAGMFTQIEGATSPRSVLVRLPGQASGRRHRGKAFPVAGRGGRPLAWGWLLPVPAGRARKAAGNVARAGGGESSEAVGPSTSGGGADHADGS